MTTFYLVSEHGVSDEGTFDAWLFSDKCVALQAATEYLTRLRSAYDFPDTPMYEFPPEWDTITMGAYNNKGDYVAVYRLELDAGIR